MKKYTIYGERCTGTNYLQNLIDINFDAEITWDYGWKHFFGSNINNGWYHFNKFKDGDEIIDNYIYNEYCLDKSDDVLFICITRDIIPWLNSFYREMHHLPLKYNNKLTDKEKINDFLNNEIYSFNDYNNNRDISKELMEDRNIYTGDRYKNIFELRYIKNKYLQEDLPNKVKNYIFIRYEDLINDFENTMKRITEKGLNVKDGINFPLNTDQYKDIPNMKMHNNDKKIYISDEIVLNNPFYIFYNKLINTF